MTFITNEIIDAITNRNTILCLPRLLKTRRELRDRPNVHCSHPRPAQLCKQKRYAFLGPEINGFTGVKDARESARKRHQNRLDGTNTLILRVHFSWNHARSIQDFRTRLSLRSKSVKMNHLTEITVIENLGAVFESSDLSKRRQTRANLIS